MKKLTVFILVFCYVLSLCACSDSKQKEVVEYFLYEGNEQMIGTEKKTFIRYN